MTDKILKELPEILVEYKCDIRKASRDDTNKQVMTESKIEVIDFDKIPNVYSRGRGWGAVPKSNDALYKDINGRWFFIEFKNGKFETADIYRKIYDSLIMLVDIGIVDNFEYIRNNFYYILVYNDQKNNKASKTEGLNMIYFNIQQRAQQEVKILGIGKLDGYLFKETHTYNKSQFENKFIRKVEQEESENS